MESSLPKARSWLTHSLRGVTWRRFGLLCAIVAVPAIGHAVNVALWPDKSWREMPLALVEKYVYFFLFFGPVWISVVVVGNWMPERTGARVLTLIGAVAIGLAAGNLLSNDLLSLVLRTGKDMSTLQKEIAGMVLWSHVIAAGVLGYYYLIREDEATQKLHREGLQRADLAQELAEARLQVMQAQVEPHFLFNTLANIRRLLQTDPTVASAMLAHLSRYLSAMLPRMRSSDSTLGQELALAMAYLHVQQIRMGERLTVRNEVPEALEACYFPPMMLVTLVENAVRHGINPLPQGGEVRIVARVSDDRLRVQVIDTGRGLHESFGSGVGLANIRARLTTLYSGEARLLLGENPARGVTATIELPSAGAAATSRAA